MANPIRNSKAEYVELNDVEGATVLGCFLGIYATPLIGMALWIAGCGLYSYTAFAALPAGGIIGCISGYVMQVRKHLDKEIK